MNLHNTCNSKENVELAQGDNAQIKKERRGDIIHVVNLCDII